ncbi:MAG: FG-GAP repeat protein [Chloroflexota bacterium]
MEKKTLAMTLLLMLAVVWAGSGRSGLAAGEPVPGLAGDGPAGLMIGVPGRADGALARGGSAVALFGADDGLSTEGSQFFDHAAVGAGAVHGGDELGRALAAGDFDGDGDIDVAIGAPGEHVGGAEGAGAVYVLYRTAEGYPHHAQFWHQGIAGMGSAAEAGDRFGYALAAGDFDADGYHDLAVSAPYDSVGDPSVSRAGAVQVIYGSTAGLAVTGNQGWYQDSVGIEETAEQDDCFGETLASGDFNADGFADLAVGVPQENNGPAENAGAVQIIYGSSDGLSAAGNQVWRQGDGGIQEAAEAFDLFGSALAAGDFDADGDDDLAVGASQENLQAANEGVVHVLAGSPAGVSGAANQLWQQDLLAPELAEDGDMFGAALGAGDFNADGYVDLAIGVPREDLAAGLQAGVVHVLYGSDSLFMAGNGQMLQAPVPTASNLFGAALAAGDFDADGDADLAIGEPYADFSATEAAGRVSVYAATPSGFSNDVPQVFSLLASGNFAPGADDNFGFSLAALDASRSADPLPYRVYLPLAVRGGAGQLTAEASAD